MVDFTIPDLTAIGGALADNTLFEVHRNAQAASEKAAGSDLKTYLGHKLNNFAATTAPGVGDDANDGYSAGSYWFNTSTGALYICRDAAAGAAVWNAVQDDAVAGYVVGRWYLPHPTPNLISNSVGTNFLNFTPFRARRRVTISEVGVRVTGTGGNLQFAFYAGDEATGKPTGGALSNTNDMSMAVATTVTGALLANVTLEPGRLYYGAQNQSAGGTTTHYRGCAAFSGPMGGATFASLFFNTTIMQEGITLAQTYGTWPDVTAASFSNGLIDNPLFAFKAA